VLSKAHVALHHARACAVSVQAAAFIVIVVVDVVAPSCSAMLLC
jgi:hypothetical protein